MPGSGASKVKTGVEYAASWLAPLGFSIVEQISEAAMLDGQVGSLFWPLVALLLTILPILPLALGYSTSNKGCKVFFEKKRHAGRPGGFLVLASSSIILDNFLLAIQLV